MGRLSLCISLIAIIWGNVTAAGQGKSVAVRTSTQLSHQEPISSEILKPISIGEKMPDISFTMINYKQKTSKISDFKDKLILLDFWATWCSTCVTAFPKLDTLQNKYKGRLQVLLVNSDGTGDNEEKILKFIKTREKVDKKSFPFATVVADKSALQLFPHQEVPHYAWIAPNGTVKAITSSKEVTSENIEKILNEESIKLPQKKDFYPNKISGFEDDITIDDNLAHFSFFKRGRIEGMPWSNRFRRIEKGKADELRGLLMRNAPLMEMYETIVSLNNDYKILHHDPKRILLEMKDSSGLLNKSDGDKDNWDKQNLYSYDLVIPADQSKKIYDYALEDLNRYSGYYARIEKRKVKCWLLINLPNSNTVVKNIDSNLGYTSQSDNGKNSLENMPVPQLVEWINRSTSLTSPVIDKTTNSSSLRITIVLDMKNPDAGPLRKDLNKYGLDLRESEEELDMFIITKKP